MAKRPRFSRWRRLPGVFRSGEHRPIDKEGELDRIILYLPARLLDLAEALAEKAQVATVQEYCAQLLARAIDNERVQQKVAEVEAQRGPLEGFNQIANDPDYLAEWQMKSDTKQDPAHSADALHEPAGSGSAGASGRVEVEVFFPEAELEPALAPAEGDAHALDAKETPEGPQEVRIDALSVPIPKAPLAPTVLLASDPPAMEVLARHVGWSHDEWGFLPCLRRGQPVPAIKVNELKRALSQLEEEVRDAEVLDRRVAHALHRLALEAQVLLTDAWPGAFDERVIMAIRAVQEGVERILSGQDIRYYPM